MRMKYLKKVYSTMMPTDMAGMYSTHMHLPRMVDMKEKVAEFWQEEAALSGPRKHTLQPIVTGT